MEYTKALRLASGHNLTTIQDVERHLNVKYIRHRANTTYLAPSDDEEKLSAAVSIVYALSLWRRADAAMKPQALEVYDNLVLYAEG